MSRRSPEDGLLVWSDGEHGPGVLAAVVMVTQPGVVWRMGRGQASHALTGVAEVGILLGSVFLNTGSFSKDFFSQGAVN